MSTETQTRALRPKMEFDFVPIDKIERNRLNPRRVFPDRELDSLCKSIMTVGGIVVPLVAFKKDDRYVLLDGERRLKAAKRLGMKEVPVNIMPKELSDSENISEMFTIHKEREEWNPVARAMSLAQLRALTPGISDEELQKISGMKENDIREADMILSFPSKMQDRALNQHIKGYGIRPAYLVEIGRALEATRELFPQVIEKYGREKIIDRLIAKVDSRTIRNATHFRKVTDAVKIATEREVDQIFQRLLDDKQFTPKDIDRIVPPRVSIDQIRELKTRSQEFLVFLGELPLGKSDPRTKKSAKAILRRLLVQIDKKLRQL